MADFVVDRDCLTIPAVEIKSVKLRHEDGWRRVVYDAAVPATPSAAR